MFRSIDHRFFRPTLSYWGMGAHNKENDESRGHRQQTRDPGPQGMHSQNHPARPIMHLKRQWERIYAYPQLTIFSPIPEGS